MVLEVETALIPAVYRFSVNFGFCTVWRCKHVLYCVEVKKNPCNVKLFYIQRNMMYVSAHKVLGRYLISTEDQKRKRDLSLFEI